MVKVWWLLQNFYNKITYNKINKKYIYIYNKQTDKQMKKNKMKWNKIDGFSGMGVFNFNLSYSLDLCKSRNKYLYDFYRCVQSYFNKWNKKKEISFEWS